MTLATSIRTAVRNLINTFGNSISVYTFSAATKTENDEGDITVTDWGNATAGKCVDGNNLQVREVLTQQGIETIGEDQIIIRDDLTIAQNDRLTRNGVEYRLTEINPIRVQDTLIAQNVTIKRATGTTNWP